MYLEKINCKEYKSRERKIGDNSSISMIERLVFEFIHIQLCLHQLMLHECSETLLSDRKVKTTKTNMKASFTMKE